MFRWGRFAAVRASCRARRRRQATEQQTATCERWAQQGLKQQCGWGGRWPLANWALVQPRTRPHGSISVSWAVSITARARSGARSRQFYGVGRYLHRRVSGSSFARCGRSRGRPGGGVATLAAGEHPWCVCGEKQQARGLGTALQPHASGYSRGSKQGV